ncbi:YdeI/OmpD-associated family protein [Arsenicibacter rosenii]|uniref:Bacteriocin-protection protein n=1 Tax=Arsenicibacter rosenii TaxID=1750698 RepID=A0A1S2VDT4_9BACT|nr:YdeI/OmpD-associated family protein [Arsenicibacter rosenii]OIN56445.1 hypothetical protein BLX24_25060 [Arsenicibacter rosenii]
MQTTETNTFGPASRQEWRQWLAENHQTKQSVWLIFNKKQVDKSRLSWSESVDEALCFGWIDSKAKTIDENQYMQFFSKRKPKSVWSKINKEKIQRLISEGLMMPAGYASILIAKQNGSWSLFDDVEELIIPDDLTRAFANHEQARTYFLGLSKSIRKAILQWLVLARQPETRQRRITEIVTLAGQQQKPKQFR